MSNSHGILVLSLAIGVASAAPVLGAGTAVFEEEVTVTATGDETAVLDVPVPVTVITRREMDDAQTESVAEILRRVPGVTVAQAGGEGSVTSVFTRGTESDHTLVLFDGVRLNSPYFGGFDWSQATTAGLERIEVARGPYSALWGPDAVGGVVNMIPGRRGEDGLGTHIVIEGGEESWGRYQGTIGFASGPWDIFASGIQRDGEQVLENSDFEMTEFLVDVGLRWGRASRVAILAQNLDSETGIPFDGALMTENRRQQADQTLLAIPVQFQISNAWRLDITGSSVERDFSFSDPDDALGYTFAETSTETVEFRVASHHKFGNTVLTWGGGRREDEVSDVSSFGVNLDGDSSKVDSFFIQDVWAPSPRFRLIIGARWDDTEAWGSEISPRLNLGWKLTDQVELRLGYGEAFRQPSVGELYFPFSGNPDLEAETSRSFEVGLVLKPRASRAVWQINYFETDLKHLIDFDYASYRFANTEKAEIRGLEVGLEVPFNQVYASSLTLTRLDTEDDDGEQLLRRPEWSACYTVTGLLIGSLRGDVSLLWVGGRDDIDPVTFERTQVDSFFTANLVLEFPLTQAADLTLRVLNLSDEDYEEVLGYPAPRRRFIGGLRIRL